MKMRVLESTVFELGWKLRVLESRVARVLESRVLELGRKLWMQLEYLQDFEQEYDVFFLQIL